MLPAGLQIMFANSTKLSHSCDLSMCWSAAALLCESVVKYFLGWGKSISRGGGRSISRLGEGGLMAVENHNCSGKHHFLLSLALAFDLYGAKNHTKCNKILQRDEIKSIRFSNLNSPMSSRLSNIKL